MTVKDLIKQLQKIEDQDSPIVVDTNNERKWFGGLGEINTPIEENRIVKL